MTPQLPSDPYQSLGTSADGQSAARPAPRGGRPGGLTAICVIAICLGGLGLGSSLWAMAALTFQKQLQQTFAPPQPSGTGNPALNAQLAAQLAAQRDMNHKMQAIGDRYRTANLALALLNLFVAGGLLAGGIMALMLSPLGRTLLVTVFALAIALVIVRGTFYVFQQLEMWPVMSEFADRITPTAPKGPPGAGPPGGMMKTIMTGTFAVVLALCLALDFAKLVFYAYGVHYLRRPAIRRLFEPAG
jgi:hypothetical protein